MKTRRFVVAAACAAALAVGCSKSSTGPSNPLVGTWSLHIYGISATQTIAPDPIIFTLGTNGASYTASYSPFTWSYTSPAVSLIDTWSPSSFAITGDSMLIVAHDASAPNCYLTMGGVISGTTATGVSVVSGAMCVPGGWPWTATKQ